MKTMTQLEAMASGVWFKSPRAEVFGRLDLKAKVMHFDSEGHTSSVNLVGSKIDFDELFKVVQVREEETAEASL